MLYSVAVAADSSFAGTYIGDGNKAGGQRQTVPQYTVSGRIEKVPGTQEVHAVGTLLFDQYPRMTFDLYR
jgi:hypothetical protein